MLLLERPKMNQYDNQGTDWRGKVTSRPIMPWSVSIIRREPRSCPMAAFGRSTLTAPADGI